MKIRYIPIVLIVLMTTSLPVFSQSTNCNPVPTSVDSFTYVGTGYLTYGSIARSRSQKYRSSASVGQLLVGYTENTEYNSNLGFFSRYLLPPFALEVKATQGDLLDRIQISWEVDGLGPTPNEGFNIYRDGIFLATVGPNIRNYNDFNVIAGVAYTYTVRGINAYGEGQPSYALGFQVPNGVVTGWIRTKSGSPVPDAVVTLTPMQGFSAKFDENDAALVTLDSTASIISDGGDWTLTFWLKTNEASENANIINLGENQFFIRAIASNTGHEGIEIADSPDGVALLTTMFADSVKNNWNHIAVNYEAATSQMRVYINGSLSDLTIFNTTFVNDAFLKIGNSGTSGGWNGNLDELRIYNTLLNELDFSEIMYSTASSQTPNLRYYWKMDEELGLKSYDIVNRVILNFCGASFDKDRPQVHTAGKTNSDGYYKIESASYGTGTTFLAAPSKLFYLQKSVKLNKAQNSHITIPDFSIPQKSTIELWVNSSGSSGTQSLLSKKSDNNDFNVFIESDGITQELKVTLNGNTHAFGNIERGYQHIAITIDSVSNLVQLYKNGIAAGSENFNGDLGDLSGDAYPWRLGVYDNGIDLTDYFNGLIDEFAIYDTILSPTLINGHFQSIRDPQEKGLYVNFHMNEGAGNRISNTGSLFLDFGTLNNCEWSVFAPNQVTKPHEFSPKTRQVTLNPSVTSVDQVDFIDNSTVPVSGYVRYKNTNCFARNVEILVNNSRFNPPVFTDSTGRFVIDFDPGASAKLTPKLEDHVFVPAFWDVTNVSSPVSGIIFNDITTRNISGIVAGGSNPSCRTSIIRAPAGDESAQGTVCRVEVRSADDCFVRTIKIDNVEGEFEFTELPPLEKITVSVIQHSNNTIKEAFQVEGGSTVNLVKEDTTVNFIYIAPPVPEITSGLDTIMGCSPGVIVLDKGEMRTITIRLKEVYDGGDCYLDTAQFNIINGFADMTLDTTMSGGSLQYTFRTGAPNISPPYLKTLQIIGTSDAGRKGSLVKQAIVTGIKEKLPSFTTKLPERPFLVLHDPPGDGSYAYVEKDSSICYNTSLNLTFDVSDGLGTTFNLIPKFTYATGFLFEVQNEIAPILGGSLKFTTTFSKVSDSTFETCVQTTQRISTDDTDLIVGGDGGSDIFMGAAQNIILAQVDEVTFDTCTVSVIESIALSPGEFATTFIYSEYNIRNYVLPNLYSLLTDTTPSDSIAQSIARWEKILNDNDARKASAQSLRNISFDAGVIYEHTEIMTSSNTASVTLDTILASDGSIDAGIYADDLGFLVSITSSYSSSFGYASGTSTQYGSTVGYVLKDDDPGDFFSVDIGVDTAYLTPTFKLVAGQSSCPWEPGTANREAPNLALGIGVPYIATNVPAHEPAVFKMFLGNESATNEDWTYGFTAIAGSNPDGAIIKLNGQPLNSNTIQYHVPYGSSVPITLTVDRGPIAYEYRDLQVALVSECEMERNFALTIPLDEDEKFFSGIKLGVDFIRPCSEVRVNFPEQNWVVFNNDTIQPGPKKLITVSGYDLNSSDFQLVRLQYRRSDGNGAWINIPDTSDRYNPYWSGFADLPNPKPATLRPDFTNFIWDTEGLADGNYEIHAWAVCTGSAIDKPGFSEIIKGRIDREPPSLVGRPQPADGVYHVGDEISFTFNKHINCKSLNPIDDVLLFDTETGDPVEINITCFENKIVLDPVHLNKFYENKILRAELHNIEDLVGNVNVFEKWEFYVDRNELAWLTESLKAVKYADESKTVSAKIHNRGGYPVSFSMVDVPDWMHVYPNTGTLVANEVLDINISFDDQLPLGESASIIKLRTETGINPFFMGGDEPLNVTVNTICRPETWVLNPAGFNTADYSFSMNFIVQLDIEGTLSMDENDLVGAYVGGDLRGIAKVVYRPEISKYLAFLTVYSNVNSGEIIQFQIWDASDCKLYAYALETFTFAADDIQGTLADCIILHTNTTLLKKIFLHKGWNWISVNLDLSPDDINPALSTLSNPTGALIKDQTTFSTYSESTSSWIGTLQSIQPAILYQYNAQSVDSVSLIGYYIDPETRDIPLHTGWNWIGYLPSQSLSVNEALANITPGNGDLLKSQLHFAQYAEGIGWIGSLKTMNAPNGYLLKLANADTLTYPNPFNLRSSESSLRNLPDINVVSNGYTDLDIRIKEGGLLNDRWEVDPTQFEYSMNIIGVVVNTGDVENMLHDNDEIGAFIGGEIRGTGKAIFVPELNAYMAFMTIYSNTNQEKIELRFFDVSTGKEYHIIENPNFQSNGILGSVDAPLKLHLGIETSVDDESGESNIYMHPNPFTGQLNIRVPLVSVTGKGFFSVKDISGKQIYRAEIEGKPGINHFEWKPDQEVSPGAYFISLHIGNDICTRKVIYIK